MTVSVESFQGLLGPMAEQELGVSVLVTAASVMRASMAQYLGPAWEEFLAVLVGQVQSYQTVRARRRQVQVAEPRVPGHWLVV